MCRMSGEFSPIYRAVALRRARCKANEVLLAVQELQAVLGLLPVAVVGGAYESSLLAMDCVVDALTALNSVNVSGGS